MFGFLRKLRRRRWLRDFPLSDELWKTTRESHPIFQGLSPQEDQRLRDLTTLFLHEKKFNPAPDLEFSPADQVSLGAQACLPILNLGLDCYNGWTTIIVVPGEFHDRRTEVDGHLVHESDEALGGEVLEWGPVVFSLEDIKESGWGTGYNVVIHEMAHKLDALTGEVNGCPRLPRFIDDAEWKQTFTEAFRDLTHRARRLGRRAERELPIDPYAVTDPGEFFAVVSEVYFEQPALLKKEYPGVFRLLAGFYGQRPELSQEDLGQKNH